MEVDFRPQRSSLANSDCGSNVSSVFHLNAHTQLESNSSLDKASGNNQRFYDSSKPSHGRIGETINLSGKLISQREPQLLINSNQTYSFRSNSSDSSCGQPPTSLSNTNSNYRIYSTEAGRPTTSSYQNWVARNPNSILQVGSDEIFYISTDLNPLTSTCVQSDPSQNQNLHISQSPYNHVNLYKPSHEQLQTASQQLAILKNPPSPEAQIYTNPLPTPRNVSHISLHNVQYSPLQTRNIHSDSCVNPSPTMKQQPSQTLQPDNMISDIADKFTNFDDSTETIDLLNRLELPVLVPKGDVGTGSMGTLNNHSSTFNRPRSNGQTIYVKPKSDMSYSSHPPSTVTTSAQCNRNEDHPIPVIEPISKKLIEAKSNDVRLIEYSKKTFSHSSERKCINNKPLNKNLPQNSRDPSLTSKKKREKPPKSTIKIRKRSISSSSHKISNKRYGFEISRSHNVSKSSWSNLHRSSNLPHQSSKNSSPANIHQPDVSASSPSNQTPSRPPANKSQLSESLGSPSLRVVFNCPYNDAELVGSTPRSAMVTTINITGYIIVSNLMNKSKFIDTLTQVFIFHDHQPGICSQYFSTNLVSSRDNTDNMEGTNDSTESSEKNDTDQSQGPSDSEPCDSEDSQNSGLKSHQTDANSLETQKTQRPMNTKYTSTARTRSNDSSSSQMSDGYALHSKVTCSHQDTNVVPTSCQIDIRKDRIQGHDQLMNIERNPNYHHATAARGNDPHSNVSHPQRFDIINYDEIESIDYEEKFLSNSHNICSSFQQNGSTNRFDDLRKQQKISGSGGSSTQSSSNGKYKQTKILPFGQNIPGVQSISSISRWVTLDSPIKRTVDLHGEVFHRKYFTSIKLDELTLSVGDSVLRNSNYRSNWLSYVGISSAFWIDVRTRKPQSKNYMKYGSSTLETDRIGVLLYYRPYQIHLHSDLSSYGDNKLIVSKHVDDDPALYIVEMCLVLSYTKHPRYRSFKALKSLIPTPLADRRPFSCFKNMEDLSNVLESDLKLLSSKLVDFEARKVSNGISSIFPSPEEMFASSFPFHVPMWIKMD